MSDNLELVEPFITPPLDPDFRPAVLANEGFLAEVRDSAQGVPLRIALERGFKTLAPPHLK